MKRQSSRDWTDNGRTGRGSGFCRWGRAGNAENPWFFVGCERKSLIPEASTATRHPVFATSYAAFATCPISASAAAGPFFFLSNSLKKKKKEYEEGQGIGHCVVPRVKPVLPSVAQAAYFLGHEFSGLATGE
ncbi:hypothetical protein [Paraburkholderia heleia]|uniref:hypothetical protein n=1 Tax=Paraburkholderia heleia TaxID=634127 RepID=UPI002AB7DCFC|nr:hypothetical protein [Paraburkholderia heleia]